MADYTVTGLLASIRRRASIPTTSTTGGANADLLSYANEELRLGLVAEILRMREGYFKRDSDTTISGSTYRIPTRAIGGKLNAVQLVDSAGSVLQTLPEYDDARLEELSSSTGVVGYVIAGMNVVLVPGSTTSATSLRLKYFAQPNELVSSGYATVLSFVAATGVVTTSAAHGFTTASVLDIVRATEGFESQAIDQTPTAASGSSLTFSSLPSDLAVGDYVCVARQSPVPQIPSEFHPILAQRVAVAYLEAGGAPELGAAVAKLGAMEKAIGILSSPRVDASAKKIVPRFGPLGGLRRRRVWGV